MREKRLKAQREINYEKMAEMDAEVEARILRAKEERLNSIRDNEARVHSLSRVPFAQRNKVQSQQQVIDAESGSVGTVSNGALALSRSR